MIRALGDPVLRRPGGLGRPNALDTEWGHDDVVALAGRRRVHDVPKVRRGRGPPGVPAAGHEHGADPLFIVLRRAARGRRPDRADRRAGLRRRVRLRRGGPDRRARRPHLPARRLAQSAAAPSQEPNIMARRCETQSIRCLRGGFLWNIRYSRPSVGRGRRRAGRARCATALIVIYLQDVDVHLSIFTPSWTKATRRAALSRRWPTQSRPYIPWSSSPNGAMLLVDDLTKARRGACRAGLADVLVTGEPVVEMPVDRGSRETAVRVRRRGAGRRCGEIARSVPQLRAHEPHQPRPHRVPRGRRPVPGLWNPPRRSVAPGVGRRAAPRNSRRSCTSG